MQTAIAGSCLWVKWPCHSPKPPLHSGPPYSLALTSFHPVFHDASSWETASKRQITLHTQTGQCTEWLSMHPARYGAVFNLGDLRNLVTPSELWDWNECSQAAAEECTRVTIPTELSLYPSSELWMQNEQQKQQLYQWSLGISARASEKKGVESRNWGVGGTCQSCCVQFGP